MIEVYEIWNVIKVHKRKLLCSFEQRTRLNCDRKICSIDDGLLFPVTALVNGTFWKLWSTYDVTHRLSDAALRAFWWQIMHAARFLCSSDKLSKAKFLHPVLRNSTKRSCNRTQPLAVEKGNLHSHFLLITKNVEEYTSHQLMSITIAFAITSL